MANYLGFSCCKVYFTVLIVSIAFYNIYGVILLDLVTWLAMYLLWKTWVLHSMLVIPSCEVNPSIYLICIVFLTIL